MDPIHFCRDGILRRRTAARNAEGEVIAKLVPLAAWEAAVDPDVFLKSLHSTVTVEPGLTIGELFENLAPWAETMTGVAVMDFPAFLDEVRTVPEQRLEECDRIVLRYGATVSPVPAFDRPMELNVDRTVSLGEPVKTGRLQLEQGWTMDAMLTEAGRAAYDGAEAVSLSFTPLSEWAHLPIVISHTAELRDETAYDGNHAYLGTDRSLTAADHPNVVPAAMSNGTVMAHGIAIDAPCPSFFGTIVRGLLWDIGFHYAPVAREAARQSVVDAMGEIDESDVEIAAPEDKGEDEDDAEDRVERDRMARAVIAAADMNLETRDIPDDK